MRYARLSAEDRLSAYQHLAELCRSWGRGVTMAEFAEQTGISPHHVTGKTKTWTQTIKDLGFEVGHAETVEGVVHLPVKRVAIPGPPRACVGTEWRPDCGRPTKGLAFWWCELCHLQQSRTG